MTHQDPEMVGTHACPHGIDKTRGIPYFQVSLPGHFAL
jgi:hypothetical protein